MQVDYAEVVQRAVVNLLDPRVCTLRFHTRTEITFSPTKNSSSSKLFVYTASCFSLKYD